MVTDPRVREWIDVAHAESAARVRRSWTVLERAGVAGRATRLVAPPASLEQLQLVHTAEHVEAVRAATRSGELMLGRPRSPGRAHELGCGRPRGRSRVRRRGLGLRSAGSARLLPGSSSGASRLARSGDGVLPVQQRRPGGAPRAAGSRPEARRDRRLGRPPRQRHTGGLLRRRRRPVRLDAPGRPLSGGPGRGLRARDRIRKRRHREHPAPAGIRRRRLPGRLRAPRCTVRGRIRAAADPSLERTGRRGVGSTRQDERYDRRVSRR